MTTQRSLDLGLDAGDLDGTDSDGTDLAEVDELYKQAMKKAGRALARRPLSSSEMRTRLTGEFDPVADRVLTRLTEMRLLDDAEFARRWVQERSTRKGHRALVAELAGKGIDRETAEQAIADCAPDEATVASDLASLYLRKVSSKPPHKQAASIQAMLVRRGYSYEVAATAARAVLPPEGWD